MNATGNLVKAYEQGGLGNQCFIYATARALAMKVQCCLVLDLDYLAEDWLYKRRLALGQFDCICELKQSTSKIVRVLKGLRYKLLRGWNWGSKEGELIARIGNYCWDVRPFRFRRLPTEWQGTLTLDGYWQSEKYFYDIREQLLKDFRLKDGAWVAEDAMAQQIQSSENSVFLHVRSYKEVPGKEDGQCALQMIDYYRKAITYIVQHVENPAFFIFSDDVAFARELVSPLFSALGTWACTYIEPLCSDSITSNPKLPSAQIRDFTLMRMCKHGIVADSSFSWWAGWLGEQERLLEGEAPIRLRVNRRVMNDDFWPERWVAVDG